MVGSTDSYYFVKTVIFKVVERASEYLMGNAAKLGREDKRIDALNTRIDKSSKATINLMILTLVIFSITYIIIRIFP